MNRIRNQLFSCVGLFVIFSIFSFISPLAAESMRGYDLTLNWERNLNAEVMSSPAVNDALVIVGTKDSSDGKIVALDRDTGKLRWSFHVGSWVESSPAIRGDSVYIGSEKGTLYALDIDDGSVAWKRSFDENFFASPFVWRDWIFMGGGKIRAFNRLTGETIWTRTRDGRGFTSPVVEEGILYAGTSDPGRLIALDAQTGRRRWEQRLKGGMVEAAPMAGEENVYIGDWDHTMHAVDKETGQRRWEESRGGRLDPASVAMSPLVVDGRLVWGNTRGDLLANMIEGGAVEWSKRYDEALFGSPVRLNDDVLVTTEGSPAVLDFMNPRTGKSLTTYSFENRFTWSTPAYRDDTLYIGFRNTDDTGGSIRSYRVNPRSWERNWSFSLGNEETMLTPKNTRGKWRFPTQSRVYTFKPLTGIQTNTHGYFNKTISGYADFGSDSLIVKPGSNRIEAMNSMGDTSWSHTFDSPIAGDPSSDKNAVQVLLKSGHTRVLTPERGRIIDRGRLPFRPSGAPIWLDSGPGGVAVSNNGSVTRFNSRTGTIEWQKEYLMKPETVEVDRGQAYLFFPNGELRVLKLSNGAEQWTGPGWNSPTTFLGSTYDKLLIRRSGTRIVAFDKQLGDTVWTQAFPSTIRTPAAVQGAYVHLVTADGKAHVLRRRDGQVIAERRHDNRYSVGTRADSNYLMCVDDRGVIESWSPVPRSQRGAYFQRSTTVESVRWSMPTGMASADQLSIQNDVVIGRGHRIKRYREIPLTNERGHFSGNSHRTGEFFPNRPGSPRQLDWQLTLNGTIEALSRGNGSRLAVTMSAPNRLVVIDRRRGRVIWTKSLPSKPTYRPVISGNRVWLGLRNHELRSYDINSGTTKKRRTLESPVEYLKVRGSLQAMKLRSGTVAVFQGERPAPKWSTKVSLPSRDGAPIGTPFKIYRDRLVVYGQAHRGMSISVYQLRTGRRLHRLQFPNRYFSGTYLRPDGIYVLFWEQGIERHPWEPRKSWQSRSLDWSGISWRDRPLFFNSMTPLGQYWYIPAVNNDMLEVKVVDPSNRVVTQTLSFPYSPDSNWNVFNQTLLRSGDKLYLFSRMRGGSILYSLELK